MRYLTVVEAQNSDESWSFFSVSKLGPEQALARFERDNFGIEKATLIVLQQDSDITWWYSENARAHIAEVEK
jgi:hypothetical protein